MVVVSEQYSANDYLDALHLKRARLGLPSLETMFRYCPQIPNVRQMQGLDLTCLEAAMIGGGGGGKSSWLMMAALMYVDQPDYAALILRKTAKSLRMPGGLIPRSHDWLDNTDATWNGTELTWTFPSGAILQFGYVATFPDAETYRSTEAQFIGFEEFSEFDMQLDNPEINPYLYLRRSLRQNRSSDIPLRVRCASNPGSKGHRFMVAHYMTEEARQCAGRSTTEIFWKTPDRACLPSFYKDNTTLNTETYAKSLDDQPTVMKAQMRDGDVNIKVGTFIKESQFRFYKIFDGFVLLYDGDGNLLPDKIPVKDCDTFVTVDAAGTSADEAKKKKGTKSSFSAIGVWLVPPAAYGKMMFCREVIRERLSIPELINAIRAVNTKWRPSKISVENEKFGKSVVQLTSHNLPTKTITTGGQDKLTRAVPLINAFANGQVCFPIEKPPWFQVYLAEVTTWTGGSDEISDQIDMSAYAGQEVFIASPPMWEAKYFSADFRYTGVPAGLRALGVGMVPAIETAPAAIVCAALGADRIYLNGHFDNVGSEVAIRNIPGVMRKCFPDLESKGVAIDESQVHVWRANEQVMRGKGFLAPVIIRGYPEIEIVSQNLDSGIRDGTFRYALSDGGNAIISNFSSYPEQQHNAIMNATQLAMDALVSRV